MTAHVKTVDIHRALAELAAAAGPFAVEKPATSPDVWRVVPEEEATAPVADDSFGSGVSVPAAPPGYASPGTRHAKALLSAVAVTRAPTAPKVVVPEPDPIAKEISQWTQTFCVPETSPSRPRSAKTKHRHAGMPTSIPELPGTDPAAIVHARHVSPDLSRLIEVWPSLPAKVRHAILTVVEVIEQQNSDQLS